MDEQKETLTELREIHLQDGKFKANGHTYRLYRKLSVQKWKIFDQYSHAVGWGMTFGELHKRLTKMWQAMDRNERNEPVIELYNILHGVAERIQQMHHPALMILTLFFVREDEDVRFWDEDLANEKVNDWQAEGLDVEELFHLATSLVDGWSESFENASRGIYSRGKGMAKKSSTDNIATT